MTTKDAPIASILDEIRISFLAEMIVETDGTVSESQRPSMLTAMQEQLWSAFRKGEIKGQVVYGGIEDDASVNVGASKLQTASARLYLERKGIKCAFLGGGLSPDYLDPKNPLFPPKLAAAIAAWQAVTPDWSSDDGASPKEALIDWLAEHATGEPYNLTKSGIDEVAATANWALKGGANKTPRKRT